MYLLKITEVKFLANYILDISLSNGHSIMYDITPQIHTARFQSLQNHSLYQEGHLSSAGVIYWMCGIELTLEEILMELTNTMPYRR